VAPRVSIDYSRCCGYGICVEVCPEVFTIGTNGLGAVRDGPIGELVEVSVRAAAVACPSLAIDVTERADGVSG
jgi:ferredoxin